MNAESEMRFSSSQRLTLENVCLKCCLRTGESDAQALSDRITELEKKIEELNERTARGIPAAPAGAVTPASPAVPAREKKTEAPKKETAPVVKPAAADVQAAWKEAMNRLSKEDPRIWGLLTQGKISCEGNEIRWTPLKAEGAEYFIAPLNREEKKAEIRNILKTVTGADYAFSAGIPAAKERSQEENNSDDAYINKLYETFGKEPVDIVDQL